MSRALRCVPCNKDGETLAMRKSFTKKIQKKLVLLVAGGMTLCAAAAKEKVPVPELMLWIAKDSIFAYAVESARKAFVDVCVDRMHDLSLEVLEQTQIGMPVSKGQLTTVRLYSDVVKWLAERVHRDKYSLHVKHDIVGLAEVEKPHTVWVDP